MKKIIMVFVFVLAILSMTACKSTNSCASVEKQDVNTTNTNTVVVKEITT